MRYDLVCHAETPSDLVRAVWVEWVANDLDDVLLRFRVSGSEAVLVPEWQSPARADNLWQATCFELFWKPDAGERYIEFNLSPSTRWAAYAFDGYRSGMSDLELPVAPVIERTPHGIEADVDLSAVPPGPGRIGLSAVIEEASGTKSYWALAHAPGAPDFHHPDCFAVEVPAVA